MKPNVPKTWKRVENDFGCSSDMLAKGLNIGRSKLIKWQIGRHKPTFDQAVNIAFEINQLYEKKEITKWVLPWQLFPNGVRPHSESPLSKKWSDRLKAEAVLRLKTLDEAVYEKSGKVRSKHRAIDLGWTHEYFMRIRFEFRTFEEDWSAPGMEAYDDC